VLFVCGSDEHGAAITMRAMKEGHHPARHRGQVPRADGPGVQGLRHPLRHLPPHQQRAAQGDLQEFFLKLNENGAFTQQEEQQYFDDEAAKQFLADRYIMGTCPKCGNPDAYGDQCEKCGSALSPKDLIEPRSTLSGPSP
jgi:methionyl-tRNA synthetase